MVKQSAISNPQAIVDAYSDKGEYKKVVALALSKRNYQNQRNKKQLFVDRHRRAYSYSSSRTKTNRRNGIVLSENKNENTLQSLSLKLDNKSCQQNITIQKRRT
jgi:hypothetical protein